MNNKIDVKKKGWINKTDMAASLGISVQAFDRWNVEPEGRIGREVFFTTSAVMENRAENEDKQQPRRKVRGGIDTQNHNIDEAAIEADLKKMMKVHIGQNMLPQLFDSPTFINIFIGLCKEQAGLTTKDALRALQLIMLAMTYHFSEAFDDENMDFKVSEYLQNLQKIGLTKAAKKWDSNMAPPKPRIKR